MPTNLTTPPPDYKIELPVFVGPLDLLLHLIERQELDITTISLLKVTEQYLAQVDQLKQEKRVDHLIDFLVIAARLVLIKSRALLPQTPDLPADEEEEDPAEALIRQLRQYKRFKQAAEWLGAREAAGLRTYLRVAPPPKLESTLDMNGITPHTLQQALLAVLDRTDALEESVAIVQPRRITIEGQIKRLRHRLGRREPFQFQELLGRKVNQVEVAVTLLAVLELIKRQEAIAYQSELFGPIEIVANPEKSVDENEPVELTESYG